MLRTWRLHAAFAALLGVAAVGIVTALLWDPGTSIGSVLVGLAALLVGVVLILHLVLTTAFLAVLSLWRRERGVPIGAVVAVHILGLPLAMVIVAVEPDLSDAWEGWIDRRFADCVEVRSCAVAAATVDGRPGYALRLGLDTCRAMTLTTGVYALAETPTEERVRSRNPLEIPIPRGESVLELHALSSEPERARQWIVELYERRGLRMPWQGPARGGATWTAFARGPGDRGYHWSDDRVYRELPPCTRE